MSFDVIAPVLRFVTDLADQAVLLPLIAFVALLLFLDGNWRVLKAWVAATAGVLGFTLLLKLGFYAASRLTPVLPAIGLISPSGHVAAATVSYGAIVRLLGPRSWRSGHGTLWWWLAGLVVALLVGLTRVLLRDHSVAEVAVGALVGVAGLRLFAVLSANDPRSPARWKLAAAVLGAIVLFHGDRLAIEHGIRDASVQVGRAVRQLSSR